MSSLFLTWPKTIDTEFRAFYTANVTDGESVGIAVESDDGVYYRLGSSRLTQAQSDAIITEFPSVTPASDYSDTWP